MTCVKCGAEIAEGSLFCENCGARVEPDVIWDVQPARKEPVLCPHCGRNVQEGDLYCGFCGERLGEEEPAAESAAAGAEAAPETEKMEEGPIAVETEPKVEPEKAEEKTAVAAESVIVTEKAADPIAVATEPVIEAEKAEEKSAVETEMTEKEEKSAKVLELPEESELSEKPKSSEESELSEKPKSSEESEPSEKPKSSEESESSEAPESSEDLELSEDSQLSEAPEPPALLEKTAARLSRFRYLAPVAAGLVFLLVLTAFLRLFTGAGPEETRQTKVIYYHEEELYFDGQDARMLAERVTGFVPRNGSAQIQINAADREAFHGNGQN